MHLATDTAVVVFVAGLFFLAALSLGVWKYRQMATAPNGLAHPYVDIAHRAALMYSFAVLLLGVFVQFSAWPMSVDLTAAGVVVAFFAAAVVSYTVHGMRRDTDNQFVNPAPGTTAFMAALIVGEIGGFLVLLAGFARAEFV